MRRTVAAGAVSVVSQARERTALGRQLRIWSAKAAKRNGLSQPQSVIATKKSLTSAINLSPPSSAGSPKTTLRYCSLLGDYSADFSELKKLPCCPGPPRRITCPPRRGFLRARICPSVKIWPGCPQATYDPRMITILMRAVSMAFREYRLVLERLKCAFLPANKAPRPGI